MPKDSNESLHTYSERLLPLAEKVAAKNEFALPSKPPNYYMVAQPWLVVAWQHEWKNGERISHGSSEWAPDAASAAALVQLNLAYNGSRNISVYDVESGEKCYFDVGVRLKYQALAYLRAVAGGEAFEGDEDMSPVLGGQE